MTCLRVSTVLDEGSIEVDCSRKKLIIYPLLGLTNSTLNVEFCASSASDIYVKVHTFLLIYPHASIR